jgi:hypothetical protein
VLAYEMMQRPAIRYLSPYNHPYRRRRDRADVRRHSTRVLRLDEKMSAVSTPQNTVTFICRREELAADRHIWWLASYGDAPKDGYALWAINEGRWFTLVGNAAYRDPSRVINLRTARLAIRAQSRWISRRRHALFQIEPSVATHVHVPYIADDFDWRLVVSSIEEENR